MNVMRKMKAGLGIAWGIASAIFAVGCDSDQSNFESPTCDGRAKSIEALESTLFEESAEVQVENRNALMVEYAEFANACHDDPRTPEWLFRRADLLRSAGKFQEAMTQLRDVHDHYKEFDKRPVCAFLIGFIAEVDLNDREQAKTTYEQVIAVHPDSEAALWAEQSIEYLEVE